MDMHTDWIDFHAKWEALGESPYLHLCQCPECILYAQSILPTRDALNWKPLHETE